MSYEIPDTNERLIPPDCREKDELCKCGDLLSECGTCDDEERDDSE